MSNELVLKETDIFKYLTLDELHLLLPLFSEEEYDVGERVVRENEAGDAMYVIIEGSVMATKLGPNGPVDIAQLPRGSVFGEMALIDYDERSATVECLEECRLLRIARRDFARIFGEYPHVALKVVLSLCRVLCERVRGGHTQILGLMAMVEALKKQAGEQIN